MFFFLGLKKDPRFTEMIWVNEGSIGSRPDWLVHIIIFFHHVVVGEQKHLLDIPELAKDNPHFVEALSKRITDHCYCIDIHRK